MAEQQHCPGFETNKILSEVKFKCPECSKKFEVFSDGLDQRVKCTDCNIIFDAKTA